MVTLDAIDPGTPLDAARRLADELDARRVPLTLLVGPRPHPEVALWAAARRRAGDAALLHGTGDPRRTDRSPAHEAGLRLAGALRSRDALGLPVDGFAAPGWTVAKGVRQALPAASPVLSLLVDADGVHRLTADATATGSCRGAVTHPGRPATRPSRAVRLGAAYRRERAAGTLVHLTTAANRDHAALLAAVDAALDAGAVPATPAALVRAGRAVRRDRGHDPEHWSITA